MIQRFDPSTISYYDKHGVRFVEETLPIDMADLYAAFLSFIPAGGRILDLGCGAGRDVRYFKSNGYEVVGIDASAEMVAATKSVSDAEVYEMRFDEIPYHNEFDGVWACASLLHVPEEALEEILEQSITALRSKGAMYLSFKLGPSERRKDDRLFTDLDENRLNLLVGAVNGRYGKSPWITKDLRPGRHNEKWLNAIIAQAFETRDLQPSDL